VHPYRQSYLYVHMREWNLIFACTYICIVLTLFLINQHTEREKKNIRRYIDISYFRFTPTPASNANTHIGTSKYIFALPPNHREGWIWDPFWKFPERIGDEQFVTWWNSLARQDSNRLQRLKWNCWCWGSHKVKSIGFYRRIRPFNCQQP